MKAPVDDTAMETQVEARIETQDETPQVSLPVNEESITAAVRGLLEGVDTYQVNLKDIRKQLEEHFGVKMAKHKKTIKKVTTQVLVDREIDLANALNCGTADEAELWKQKMRRLSKAEQGAVPEPRNDRCPQKQTNKRQKQQSSKRVCTANAATSAATADEAAEEPQELEEQEAAPEDEMDKDGASQKAPEEQEEAIQICCL
jgi:hypothetical protein